MSNYIYEVQNLKKFFKSPKKKLFEKNNYLKAVNGVNFKIKKGETFGLVGESGCGKTTVGYNMIKLHEPNEGKLIFKGKDVTNIKGDELKEFRSNVQIVFQDPYSSLNPKKKIGWILEEPLKSHGMKDKKERYNKVIEMLEDVGFENDYYSRYPHELSGGQRQRIMIIHALMLNPDFVILDESVSALDVSVQSQILNLLNKLQEEFNLTYLFISHDLNVVHYISDRIAVMYMGEIVELATADEIYHSPKHPYTKALFSAIPKITKEGTKRIILSGDIPDPANPPKGCKFHTRCPQAKDKCSKEIPHDYKLNNNHVVKCFLYENGGEK
ncbi:MAG: ABC transporter ATP-binding protein [Thermotogota bacterium]